MIIYIYPISQRLGPAVGCSPCRSSGRWADYPSAPGDSDSTSSCSAKPEQLPKVAESPADPIWPAQSVPIPLGCGWRGWDCSPRIDGERSLGHRGGGWKGILPAGDLWGDFSQILSVFQAPGGQKWDCTHGWVEDLKMSEFSVSKWEKKGGFPSFLSQLPSPCLGTNLLPCECSCCLARSRQNKKPIPGRFPSNLWILQKVKPVGTFSPAVCTSSFSSGCSGRRAGCSWRCQGFAGFGFIQGCFPRGKKSQAGCG